MNNDAKYLRLYVYYRITVMLSHVILFSVTFSLPLLRALPMSFWLTAAGCTELITAAAGAWMYSRTGRAFRPLHLMYAAIVAVTMYLLWSPALAAPGPLIELVLQIRRINPALTTVLTGRQQLQDALFAAVLRANEYHAASLASQLTVTHGDEVQGLLHLSPAATGLGLGEQFIDFLRPHDVRFGIGIGTLETKLQPTAIGMDGPAWHRAQAAIEQAHRKRKTFVIKSPSPTHDALVNPIIDYLFAHRRGWTDSQREAVDLLQTLGSQQAVAQQLNISGAAVSKRLSACLWHEYDALAHVARTQLHHYKALIP